MTKWERGQFEFQIGRPTQTQRVSAPSPPLGFPGIHVSFVSMGSRAAPVSTYSIESSSPIYMCEGH